MAKERTMSIIKPDAICKNLIGAVINRLEISGFNIVAIKMLQLTRNQAEEFYLEHKDKFFFRSLIDFIISGPVILQVLEGEDVIRRNREIMGSTHPANALCGTIRSDYADSCVENIVHGSDSVESAIREISYFFTEEEIYTRVCIS
ncbi:nucleoside-diphosphate kinase [Blochmannia endosymbiont of Polyrhachis (Hedomyrma) turneri]|uniref:nucleoside-diphosphate kinase n=1 Tax=Blochmannia endosymbiont of Polyrhachis (Hedomyrma) turneri TaxID=1505596 RepID=UPI00061A74EF|nr:nucleoside-diphosphate kinase [Blochmannia endosymbiont of Polyrhachis (Hedomyrma) turneri]AKC60094.1 nucleoside diphosphate kinase [Blochmannia endosymbiont of Polyrhachis (Hedomyrma) turneri]